MQEKLGLILVPTDFSPYSCEAFAWADMFAKKFSSKILILHIMSERAAEEMVSVPGHPWEKVLEQEEKDMVDQFQACLVSDIGAGVERETEVAVGEPHAKIVEVAKEKNADMIVMATHGRTGLAHALMGSVAEKVIRTAPCPVFSIKPKALGKGGD
jgi:nucleotide-binding universal stress UspA family protein